MKIEKIFQEIEISKLIEMVDFKEKVTFKSLNSLISDSIDTIKNQIAENNTSDLLKKIPLPCILKYIPCENKEYLLLRRDMFTNSLKYIIDAFSKLGEERYNPNGMISGTIEDKRYSLVGWLANKYIPYDIKDSENFPKMAFNYVEELLTISRNSDLFKYITNENCEFTYNEHLYNLNRLYLKVLYKDDTLMKQFFDVAFCNLVK